MAILVVVEHEEGNVKNSTLNTLRAALVCRDLGYGDIDALVIGSGCSDVVGQMTKAGQLNKVLVVDRSDLGNPVAETWAAVVAKVAELYSHVLFSATTFGKNLMPRVAALCDVAPVSDVIKIQSQHTYIRPLYAGNILGTLQNHSSRQIISIRTTAFDPLPLEGGSADIETLPLDVPVVRSAKWIKSEISKSDRPELASARVVVSGGRGLGSAENFKLISALADKLGAAMGASRAAVDAGFAPNDWQVGQTGQVVAPQLYIAVGISGAIQHLAGMKDSKVIVAINKDPDAPIFQVADYGIVGDLFELVPQLTQALS
jgi:electron transfer flavoprotein alpha subunit